MATLSPEEIQYMQNHANDDKRANLYAAVPYCTFFPFLAVALRFIARRRVHAPFKTDDYLVLLALVSPWLLKRKSTFTDAQQAAPYGDEHLHCPCHIWWVGQTYHLREKYCYVCKSNFWYRIFRSWR